MAEVCQKSPSWGLGGFQVGAPAAAGNVLVLLRAFLSDTLECCRLSAHMRAAWVDTSALVCAHVPAPGIPDLAPHTAHLTSSCPHPALNHSQELFHTWEWRCHPGAPQPGIAPSGQQAGTPVGEGGAHASEVAAFLGPMFGVCFCLGTVAGPGL